MKKRIFLYALPFLALAFTSCKEDEQQKEKPVPEADYDVWVVNEGFNRNNASITAYCTSDGSLSADYFSAKNGRGLGDVANDILIYGSKAYVVVNVSSTVEILSVKTGKSLQQISMIHNGTPRQPRRVCTGNGKVYVCCFDGSVHRIDTATLSIDASGTAGSNPDGICYSNGKIYVSNSGGLNYPNYDSTVSVLDAQTLALEKTLNVRINPTRCLSDSYGHVWVLSPGNYDNIPACIQCIDAQKDTVVRTFEEAEANDFTIGPNALYLLCVHFAKGGGNKAVCKSITTSGLQEAGILFEKSGMQTPYGISMQESNGYIWITDAFNYSSNGDVYAFDETGVQKHKFEAGTCPKRAVFLK